MTSPVGTGPASLIIAYIREKESVPPTFSAIPSDGPFIGFRASRAA